ncbi:hypothetical protein Q8F55_003003 [Vanrija albida]|uniref:F-box domain-containing protein n=1 Tax=Vanrija albida TaxID=181172 RepID=A0ABR3QCB4_9TREE
MPSTAPDTRPVAVRHCSHASSAGPNGPAPATIDCMAYPHIVDRVFQLADHRSLLALRTACASWRDKVDRQMFDHVLVANASEAGPFAVVGVALSFDVTSPGGKLPGFPAQDYAEWRRPAVSDMAQAERDRRAALLSHVRVADVGSTSSIMNHFIRGGPPNPFDQSFSKLGTVRLLPDHLKHVGTKALTLQRHYSVPGRPRKLVFLDDIAWRGVYKRVDRLVFFDHSGSSRPVNIEKVVINVKYDPTQVWGDWYDEHPAVRPTTRDIVVIYVPSAVKITTRPRFPGPVVDWVTERNATLQLETIRHMADLARNAKVTLVGVDEIRPERLGWPASTARAEVNRRILAEVTEYCEGHDLATGPVANTFEIVSRSDYAAALAPGEYELETCE